jgi:predicted glycoside hydrolase/deacetylase ChbG (UPF0249 family)
MKKNFMLLLVALGVFAVYGCTKKGDIYLIVRADDMGMTHTVNRACIDVYQNGIARSVEVLVPAPWFEEAVKLLHDNPNYDVGVHLTLTSEWQYLKWRPLTKATSLTDKNGYFHPFIWKNDVPNATYFIESEWKLEEVEAELRAQIEMAKNRISNVTHYSAHMGFNNADPAINDLVNRLAKEYDIDIDLEKYGVKEMEGFGSSQLSANKKVDDFVDKLESLSPGIWLFVDHPGYDTDEMKGVNHIGYENVGSDRNGVTEAWTNKRVKDVIQKKGITLISYSEALKRLKKQ